MKQFSIFFCLLNLACVVEAQVLTVQDSSTKALLEFVTITSESPREMVTTNSKGMANIATLKGAEEIQLRLLGYETINRSYNELKEAGFLVVMKASKFRLNQVVISANRWKQNSWDIPQKISAIKPKEVALHNPQTTADLLAISGNVFIQKSQQGGGSPMIRGFATNRLLYSIDGVRMNTAIFRGGNIQNIISLDPFAIESTEVLFGPGSVIYGSDAIGGVMSFQTITPQLSLSNQALVSGKASTRFSSVNNERTGHFDANVGWKKWAIVTSISANKFDDLRQGSNGPSDYIKPYRVKRIDNVDRVITPDDPLLQTPSAYSQINLMQKVRFMPNKNWDLQYGFHYSETSPYGRYDRHNRMQNQLPKYAEWNYGPQKWLMNHLNITHEAENSFYDRASLRLAQQSFEESRISRNFNDDIRQSRVEEVEAYSINLDLVSEVNSRHTLFYGGEYVLNIIESSGERENISTGTKMDGPSRYPNADWSSIAVYVNDEFSLTENIKLQAGLRYNQFTLSADFDTGFYAFPFQTAQLNDGALTGSIGAVYRPIEKLVLSTNFGTAFRSPNVDDLGKVFDTEPGAIVVPNPSLSNEYAYNIDASIAYVFANTIKLDLTGYYTILQNAMVRRDFQLNGKDSVIYDGTLSQVQAIQNATIATVYGLQAGLEVKLSKGFSFSANANYQLGEEELENGVKSPSRHAAPFFGVARLSYNNDKLSLQLNTQYQAERSFNNLPVGEQGKTDIYALNNKGEPYAPEWYSINLKANYEVSAVFTISSGIENITDQRYRPYSSGISAPGRNFLMGITAKF